MKCRGVQFQSLAMRKPSGIQPLKQPSHAPQYAFELVWTGPRRRHRLRRPLDPHGVQEQQGFAKIGGMAALRGPAFTLDGETFDRGLTYSPGSCTAKKSILLPKLDRQMMFKGIPGSDYDEGRSADCSSACRFTCHLPLAKTLAGVTR